DYVNSIAPSDVSCWQSWLLPYFALQDVLEPPEMVPAVPVAYAFAMAMGVLSLLLNGLGILKLRKWNPRGGPIMQRERPEDEDMDRAKAHAAPGKVRHVWANPILWREIATRAHGRRPLLIKVAYLLVVGLVGYFALANRQPGEWAAAKTLVPLGIISL